LGETPVTAPARSFLGNEIIPLDSELRSGMLASGSAAVFAVDRHTAEREYLFVINPGEPVRPILCPPDATWTVVAVALEPSVIESPDDSPDWVEIIALETWLGKIAEAVSRFVEPGDIQRVSPGRLILAAGQRIAIGEGINFVRLDSGDGSLVSVPVKAGAIVALVPGLWLEAGGDAEWRMLDEGPATTLAGTAAILTATLDLAIPVFLAALRAFAQSREEDGRRRFATRRQQNDRVMADAVGALAGSRSAPRGQGRGIGDGGDPLQAALGAVAGALGVTLRPAAPEAERTPDRVREIAQASGLRTRTVLLSGDWWRAENGPILAWRQNGSPVALLPATAGVFGRALYDLFDPADGRRHPVAETTSAGLKAFARMVYRPLPDDLSTLSLIRHLLGPRRRDLRTVVLAGFGAAVLATATPLGAAILIGQAIPDADRNMVWQIAGGMLAAALGSACFLLTQAVAILRTQSAAFLDLQSGVWDYLLTLSPSFFRGFTAGQLRARADAVTRIHQMLSADALRSLLAGVSSLLTLAVMFWYSPGLALIELACCGVVIAVTWFGGRVLFRVQSQWQDMDERLAGLVLQSINAASKLQIAGASNRAFAHWAIHYSRKQTLTLELRTIRDRVRLVNMVMPAAATTLGFLWLLGHPIALGPFLSCMAALSILLAAVTTASDTGVNLVLTANLWQRMRTILSAPPEVHQSRAHPGRLRGAIVVENVTFRYRGDGPLVLDSVSIRAEPGECIAVTGPSGSGKSTLLNLLLRFEHPQSGAVYFDGRELSSLDIQAVRRQIGVVTQDGRVMAGSLFENICPGGQHTMEDAWEAARAAGLADDIEQMPMGMHTRVSDGGGNFSGGQRQRLLIARALVLKPSILIFDEATSALDNRTQAIVAESLKRLKATRILVAHRLSTLKSADRIYVLEKGRIVQQGSYRRLASEPGLFARLVRRQSA
jgi:NHLM bacteriocin system ABC transporter ATP-binding protein